MLQKKANSFMNTFCKICKATFLHFQHTDASRYGLEDSKKNDHRSGKDSL